ncbi:stilbene synthase [Leucobacter sp. OLIS6]|uniref:DUF2520 domain-containing protein n=1 Tax=unclassified Leucobacter TaxID=2621730 RepID=UPI000C5F7235|nr:MULTISPECIES: DUF2520 domain-containing protein [unclassified Leucobacter]PIJ54156.1 stilbene synthase [Leucobacter sp. OLES1]PII84075.1 stilbene synthase [Leucobacter sp. OLCALW19]PII88323.1 stilbene synthase [Leucobacter sp. OLTLW20]PII92310.1 stilbene synthase [Leucobacter sp. OLAS13]PII99707.1 stilbene synthase [Leucobacter sp. OLDS2]
MRIQIVGRGRMGAALAAALVADDLDLTVEGRGADGTGPDGSPVDLVLLAVPDAAIADAAAAIRPGPLLGHLSGATGLGALGARDGFSLHPLLTVMGSPAARDTDTRVEDTAFAGRFTGGFAGAFAAIDGSSEHARAVAESLADRLGLRTFRIAEADRSAYHAAASAAANFLVVVEGFAERLAATAGVPREALAPLAEAALANWSREGAAAALTGPVARGDDETVARQRAAVVERSPSDLDLFDALVTATRALAAQQKGSR